MTLRAPDVPGHYTTKGRMMREGGSHFGQLVSHRIKVGNEPSFYVLYRNEQGSSDATGGVYIGGFAPSISSPSGLDNWWAVQSLGFVPQRPNQYFILDDYGTIWCGGNQDCPGSHAPWGTETQEILMLDYAKSFYVLDKYGNIYNGYGAYTFSPLPPTFSNPIIRSAALTPDERGIYVLDGYGNVYTGGTAPEFSSLTPSFDEDMAKRIKVTADGMGYYVLDAYGRVWNGGAAPALPANYEPHVGEDWARDFELTADGQGYYMLDKEGRVHTGGTAVAPTVNLPPVWTGQDVALDLAVADSRQLEVPILDVNPDSLSFLLTPNQSHSVSMHLKNAGAGNLNWVASEEHSWLSLSSTVGTVPTSLTLDVSANSLALGTYEGVIELVSEDAINTPVSIPVRLIVVDTVYSSYLPLALQP